jgi:hypothetical protein
MQFPVWWLLKKRYLKYFHEFNPLKFSGSVRMANFKVLHKYAFYSQNAFFVSYDSHSK